MAEREEVSACRECQTTGSLSLSLFSRPKKKKSGVEIGAGPDIRWRHSPTISDHRSSRDRKSSSHTHTHTQKKNLSRQCIVREIPNQLNIYWIILFNFDRFRKLEPYSTLHPFWLFIYWVVLVCVCIFLFSCFLTLLPNTHTHSAAAYSFVRSFVRLQWKPSGHATTKVASQGFFLFLFFFFFNFLHRERSHDPPPIIFEYFLNEF